MSTGTRLAVAAVSAIIVLISLVVLADATSYQGQRGSPSANTQVTFHVETKRSSPIQASRALWYTCIGPMGLNGTVPRPVGDDGDFRATIHPSLGEDSSRRLRGCIQDITIDRVKGHLVAMKEVPGPENVR
jgi:hypothetical protein